MGLLLAGCASDKSFALVSVLSGAKDHQFNGVTQLLVDLDNGDFQDHLTYPKVAGGPYRFDDVQPLTFSVSFSNSHSGTLKVSVTPVDASGAATGFGTGSAQIDTEHVTNVTVLVDPQGRPDRPDGGSGADTVNMCEPLGEPTCGADRSCVVQCLSSGNYVGRCAATGSRQPGETCNNDCVPGSQCLAYSCDGDTVKACLKLCTTNDQCGKTKCSFPIACASPTPFHACTADCDPVGPATTGCAPGLKCFVLGADETPECDCPKPATRKGSDGAACDTTDNCQPGFLCVKTASSQVCRALCRLDSKVCPTGFVCTHLVSPDYKTFGGCLPM
jgi:hypothetical protein